MNEEIHEINFREIIEIMLKGKKIIAISIIISLLVSFLGVYLTDTKKETVKVIIAVNSPGIEKGLNPDGTKFDINLIASNAIVRSALQNIIVDDDKKSVEVDKFVEPIKRNIVIDPIVPGNIVDKILFMKKEGKDYEYFPGQFVITYNVSKDQKPKDKSGREILDALVDSYEKFFTDKYSGRTILANALGKVNYDFYDYGETSTVLHNQLSIIRNYLIEKMREGSDFRSKKTGLSFNDILESINIIDTVDIRKIDSLISAFNLTKDKEKLLIKYEYSIKTSVVEKEKKENEAKIAKDMMDNFKQEQNSVYIPGLTSDITKSEDNLKIGNSNSYYDSLAERSTNSAVEAANKVYDMQYIENEMNKIKSDQISEDTKKIVEKDVMVLVDYIKNKVENWVALTNDTTFEFYDLALNKAIKKLSPSESYAVYSKSKVFIISIAVGLFLGMFIVYFRHYWITSSIKENNI